MRFGVRHLTTYRYADTVQLSHHAARLIPRTVPGQRHVAEPLVIHPNPAVLRDEQPDYFGNPTIFFTIQEPHRKLEVETNFVVETSPQPFIPLHDGTHWERIKADLAAGGRPDLEEAMDFLFDSARVPPLSEAAHYAQESFAPGRPMVQAALDLMGRIHRDFKFDSDATGVDTPLGVVFEKRHGVCQDFAHVGIACFRAMGLAARYVSGYIRTLPPPGKEKLVGADASHAWLSVLLPGWGWLDLDPTNNQMAGEDHITVAWGRDFDDVSPLRGVVLGGGDQQVQVAVDVIELD